MDIPWLLPRECHVSESGIKGLKLTRTITGTATEVPTAARFGYWASRVDEWIGFSRCSRKLLGKSKNLDRKPWFVPSGYLT